LRARIKVPILKSVGLLLRVERRRQVAQASLRSLEILMLTSTMGHGPDDRRRALLAKEQFGFKDTVR
jgi:hypothetical protein